MWSFQCYITFNSLLMPKSRIINQQTRFFGIYYWKIAFAIFIKINKVCETAIVYEILISSKLCGWYLDTTLDSTSNEYLYSPVAGSSGVGNDSHIRFLCCFGLVWTSTTYTRCMCSPHLCWSARIQDGEFLVWRRYRNGWKSA